MVEEATTFGGICRASCEMKQMGQSVGGSVLGFEVYMLQAYATTICAGGAAHLHTWP